jgi:hypothetical protein
MNNMKFWMLAAILNLCGYMTVMGQNPATPLTASGAEAGEQFSIATLNVDGLPPKLLMLKLNPDGPGDAGTARIGKYLTKKSYDLLMLQEDFNFHNVLAVWLEDDYKLDEWSGDVGIDGHKIDFLHLQNHRYECDGLMGCWKNDLTVVPAPRTAWQQSFGKFSHANDEIITKGFRRYTVTLRDGTQLTVYNMHMDASLDEDEVEQKDDKDREARLSQWLQLKEDIIQNMDSRPVIVVGDLNSLYGRDDVKVQFIDAFNTSGLGTCGDVWVELENQGVYPEKGNTPTGETLDKILYINPATGTKIRPIAFSLDNSGYLYDGKPLGDHWPVAATFQVLSGTTGIIDNDTRINHEKASFYNLNGVRVNQPRSGIYIERQGQKGKAKKVIK